jgi:hypothetical protein
MTKHQPNNWLDWFQTRDSSSLIDHQCQNWLFSAFNASKSAKECKQQLIVAHDEWSVFLFVENFGTTKSINILHHVHEVGGTIYDQSNGVGFIQGVDADLAAMLTPDLEVLCTKPNQAAEHIPTVTRSLLATKAVNNIDTLAAVDTSTSFNHV